MKTVHALGCTSNIPSPEPLNYSNPDVGGTRSIVFPAATKDYEEISRHLQGFKKTEPKNTTLRKMPFSSPKITILKMGKFLMKNTIFFKP